MKISQLLKLEHLAPDLRFARENYRAGTGRDLAAGLTVALFTIPQAMAYAIIAGFPPAAGIATAVVASILGAAFGSSEFLVNGPTNAISVMLAANIAMTAGQGGAIERLILLTLMIGFIQILAGWLRLGSFTRFVSEPVLTGFTAGAGIYIAINQLPALLGIEPGAMVRELWGWHPPRTALFDLARTVAGLGRSNELSLAVGASTLILIRFLQWLEPRLKRRIPAPFLAIAGVTVVSYLLHLGEADTGGLKLVQDIQPVARELPHLAWPTIRLQQLFSLGGDALAIGILGSVEAIAIGKLLASRVGHKFDASRQLIGEGACNVGAALVQGFASSGSFTRTAVNFESGALTRMSVIYSGILVMAIVLLFAPAANYVPIAALAGTLVHIGTKLVNVVRIRLLIQTTISDRIVLLFTFLGVLTARHLEYALFAGIGLSLFLALRRAEGFKLVLLHGTDGNLAEYPLDPRQCGRIVALDLQGEVFFASAEALEHQLTALLHRDTRYLVLRLSHAYNLDATCVEALEQVAKTARARGGRLILAGVKPGTYGTLERAGLVRKMGAESIFLHEPTLLVATFKALEFARHLADQEGQSPG